MKYQNWGAFEKHLLDAAPLNLSLIYLAISSCAFERKKIVSRILQAVEKKESEIATFHFDAATHSVESVIGQLNTRSLFGGAAVIVFDGVEKLKKAMWEPLLSYVERPNPSSFLILGATSSKGLNDLYLKGKKELIALDLSDEKPWDRKARLEKYLVHAALQEGKSLSPQAATVLLDLIGVDLPALDQEMSKLFCYVGERKQITLEDIAKICPGEKNLGSWQLAEAIVWGDKVVPTDTHFDLSGLLPLIGQIRYQLQIGYQIASLLEKGSDLSSIRQQFPQLKGPSFEKKVSYVKFQRSIFFKRSLHYLFEMELSAKNSSSSGALLIDLFNSQISCLKKKHAPAFTS